MRKLSGDYEELPLIGLGLGLLIGGGSFGTIGVLIGGIIGISTGLLALFLIRK